MRTKNSRYYIEGNTSYYIEQGYLSYSTKFKQKHGFKLTKKRYFEEISRYCGVTTSTISQIHVRNLVPSYIVAIKLSEYLNINVTDLLTIKELEELDND